MHYYFLWFLYLEFLCFVFWAFRLDVQCLVFGHCGFFFAWFWLTPDIFCRWLILVNSCSCVLKLVISDNLDWSCFPDPDPNFCNLIFIFCIPDFQVVLITISVIGHEISWVILCSSGLYSQHCHSGNPSWSCVDCDHSWLRFLSVMLMPGFKVFTFVGGWMYPHGVHFYIMGVHLYPPATMQA